MMENGKEDYSKFFPGIVDDEEKYLNLFEYIKSEIYSNLIGLPEIKERIKLRRDYRGAEVIVLEYLIYNDKEQGTINNIFTLDGDTIDVTTYVFTLKDEKVCRDVTYYSGFFKEDGKEYFEMSTENGTYLKKEEINSKKL